MERVVQETLAATEQDGPWDGATVEALQGVARQYAGAPWALQPVLVALVRAVLSVRLAALVSPAESWQTMAQRIAETLWEDPRSQERLRTLWTRLTEAGR